MPGDMESELFCGHLVERLRWGVEDAHGTPSPAELDGEQGYRPTREASPDA